MFHNRLARRDEHLDLFPPAFAVHQTANGSSSPKVLFVVPTVQQAAWHAQVYRMAYERAVADLAPPAHFRRFFSHWN